MLGPVEVALFENLYVAYASEARGVARAILSDNELAADAVHNGFLEMLRYLVAGRRWYDPGDARGMVLRNVRWAALKAHRSRSRLSLGVESAPAASDDAMWARAEARALCEQIVGQLRASHQTAIRLRYVEGLTNIEAARRLGVPVPVFASRLQRAIDAARRSARSTRLMPEMALLAVAARRFLRRRRPARWPHMIPVARTLTAMAAVAFTVHCAVGWTAAGSGGVAQPVRPRLIAAGPMRAQLDSIDDSVILDAVVLPSRVVFAVARGRSCGCLVVFRSLDEGTSWDAAPGPSASAVAVTLAVATGSPMDPRIVIDPGGGQPIEVSPRFGAPFAVSRELPIAQAPRHPQICGKETTSVYCSGHAVADHVSGGTAGDGALLRIAGNRLLYFRPLGGLLCSADGGVSWGPRCAPGTSKP